MAEAAAPPWDGAGAPSSPTSHGLVEIIEEPIPMIGTLTVEAADFRGASTTQDRADGSCLVHSLAGAQGAARSAGEITLTRGSDVLTLAPDGNNRYVLQ